MARRLKNLAVRKVDFVDQGANPDAHIRLFKRRDGAEGGKDAGTEPMEGAGQKEEGGIWKRLLHFLAKAANMGDSEMRHILEDVGKGGSRSFAEEVDVRRSGKIMDEIWDLCTALSSSLCSILNDGDLDASQASDAMQGSVREFAEVMAASAAGWSCGKAAGIIRKHAGKMDPAELEAMKSARDRLSEEVEKASAEPEEVMEQEKGEPEEMKIDKSKLTLAERAFLEDIEKRCGQEDEGGDAPDVGGGAETPGRAEPSGDGEAASNIGKAASCGEETPAVPDAAIPASQASVNAGDGNDIYKGLHPDVAAEMEELKKFREGVMDRELAEVAKKYAIIGKKAEELVPTLKNLKAAGGTAYDDMIAVLDDAVDTVEKSGAFGEIGKSGGNSSGNAAEAKISDIAKGYMAKNPTITYDAAVAKAWENNPDIMAEYEEQEGF